jgi:hypothetical protein
MITLEGGINSKQQHNNAHDMGRQMTQEMMT